MERMVEIVRAAPSREPDVPRELAVSLPLPNVDIEAS